MIIEFSVTATGCNFDGRNIVLVYFVVIGFNNIATALKKFNHDVEVLLDLVVFDCGVINTNSDIDVIIGISEDNVWHFSAVFLVNFGGSQSVKIGGDFDEELIIVNVVVCGFDFFAITIFDA